MLEWIYLITSLKVEVMEKTQPSGRDWKNMENRDIPSYIITRKKIWRYQLNAFGKRVVRGDRKLKGIK